MRFDNHITELFTTDVDLDIKSYKDEWKAQFRVEGVGYEFFASLTTDQLDSDKKSWEVSFYHWNSRRSEFPPAPSLKVFNAVVQAFTKFVKAKNPMGVWFSPSSRKLHKLYGRFERYMNKAGLKRVDSNPNIHQYRKNVSVNEIFTTKVPVRVTWSGNNAFNVKFEADPESYEVYFSRLQVGNLYAEKAKINPNTWEVNFQDMGLAGYSPKEISPFVVFSGVIAAFKKFIKEKKPSIIVFDPSSAQLKKIYDRFVKPIERMGFKRSKGPDEISRLAHFVFVRKGYIAEEDYLTEAIEYFSYKKFPSGKIRISYRLPEYKTSVSKSKFKEDEEFGALLMDPSKELPEYYRVQNAVLDDDFIGKGYGIKLYKHALKVAKKEGFKGIVSNIKHRNKLAERVWKRLNAKRLKNYDVVE